MDVAEWQARVDLAAAYRLVAHFGWTHLISNHISARVPGHPDQFLINGYGLLYDEITASNLIKVDVDGQVIGESKHPCNPAGFVIHSAIHMSRPDLHAVLHTHTVAGMAVSALDCGLLPLNISAMRFIGDIAYHDFEGVSVELGERERLVSDLGSHKCMILRHHGLLAAGANVGEAFVLMYNLEKACATQMQVLASNQSFSPIPSEPRRVTERFMGTIGMHGQLDWPALVRLADRLDPSFRD